MSTSHRDPREQPTAAHFPEAVAQWRLAMRTEVKRTSSLPSSMFDACDPMLEMRLAESTEAMLACLHEPTVPVVHEPGDGGEKRVEKVSVDELRMLPARIAGAEHAETDLDAGLATEALTVLADACCSGHEIAAAGAAYLLRAQVDIDAAGPADAAVAVLLPLLQQTGAGSALAAGELEAVCRRIVDQLRQHPGPRDDGVAP